MSQPPGAAIATPPDFPVAWEGPGDEHLLWSRDRMHFPDPVTPLTAELGAEAGQNRAAEAYAMPIRFRMHRFNGYMYTATRPATGSPEEMAAAGAETQRRTGEAIGDLLRRWDQEWLPEVQAALAGLEGLDCSAADRAGLLRAFDDALARARRMWEIHFLAVFPATLATSLFCDLYLELFPGASELDADRLLRVRRHRLTEADLALWRLGREASGAREVRSALAAPTAEEALAALGGSPAGRAFLARLREYLDAYGRRSEGLDIALRTWAEDPAPVLQRLRAQLADADRDLDAEQAEREAASERAGETARASLAGYPAPVRDHFDGLLAKARDGAFLQEEHNFWIDLRGLAAARHAMLAVGARLADMGLAAAPEDVFYLSPHQIRAALSANGALDLREAAATGRREMARASGLAAPPVLGTMPPGPPPASPMGRSSARFFGGPPPAPTEDGVVRGHPGSPGLARGTARLVRTLADAGRLARGDVLVAPTTITSWSPLFATAAAVVTDTGGMLSHCAVVAREYGIPAVVGTGTATRVLRDGQTLEVDGTNGVVRVLA